MKPLLRAGMMDGVPAAVRACVAAKWEGHEINTAQFVKPLRTMHTIGG